MKKLLSLLITATLLFTLAPIGLVQAAGETIVTDLSTYEQGETINVTGSGFTAWTGVSLAVFVTPNWVPVGGAVQADQNGNFTASFVAGSWPYTTYTLRAVPVGGSQATTTFDLAPKGILVSDATHYVVGSSGVLTGTNFPAGIAKSLAVVKPDGTLVASLFLADPTAADFSAPFTTALSWGYGTFWGRAVYSTKTVTCAFVVVPVPPVPAALVATEGHNQVSLNWTAVTNPAPGVVNYSYKVYRSTTSGSGYTHIGDAATNTYLDTTAAAFAGTYYYVVTSVDDTPFHFESSYSNEASAVPWGDATSFVFGTISSPQTAGTAFGIWVTAQDVFGYMVHDYNGTAALSDTTGTIQPTSCTLLNGSVNPMVIITKAMTDVTITAQAGAIAGTSNAFDVVPGPVFYVTLSQLTGTNTVGVSHTVSALVEDFWLNPIPSKTVTFTVTGDHASSGTGLTNASGIASYTYTVTFPVGVDHIQATCDAVSSNILNKVWDPGVPANITLTQAHDTNVVGTNHTVTAVVTDTYGNPVANGTVVTFTVDRAGKSGTGVTTAGVATYTYTVTYMAGDPTDSIVATAGSATSNPLTKTWLPMPPATVVLTQAHDTNVVGDPHNLSAEVKDTYGNPVANGTVVTFTVDRTGKSGTGVTTAGVATYSYTVTFMGMPADTSDSIVATAGVATSNTLTKTWLPGPAATIDLTQEHDTNVVGDLHNLSATVYDQYGNYVPNGTMVNFTVDRTGKSGTGVTTAGVATYSYTVTFMAGDPTDTIQASVLNDPPGLPCYSNTLTKTWLPMPPATVVLTQAHDTNVVGDPHNLSAEVKDIYGNAVANGTVVTFTVDRTGKSGTGVTTAGVATYSYTVTFMAGDPTDSIVATTDSITSNTLTKTWLPGALHHFVFAAISSPQIVGNPFSITITAYDLYDNIKTNYAGPANLSASSGAITPATTGAFVAGVWTGNVTLSYGGASVTITVQDGAVSSTSTAFAVHERVVYNLTTGWNMITVPIYAGTNPNVVFASLPVGWRLYSWDAVARVYRDKNNTTVAIGQGLWLQLAAPYTLTLVGLPNEAATTTLSLASSWNLIGTPYAGNIPWANVSASKDGGPPVTLDMAVANGWIQASFYHWNVSAYEALTSGGMFGNLKGYWTKALMTGVQLIFAQP